MIYIKNISHSRLHVNCLNRTVPLRLRFRPLPSPNHPSARPREILTPRLRLERALTVTSSVVSAVTASRVLPCCPRSASSSAVSRRSEACAAPNAAFKSSARFSISCTRAVAVCALSVNAATGRAASARSPSAAAAAVAFVECRPIADYIRAGGRSAPSVCTRIARHIFPRRSRPTEFSANPANVAWMQNFAPAGGSAQLGAVKLITSSVRCVCSMTY